MEKIKIENLSFTYPERELPSLCNISLSVEDGEFVTVCGKSGCGKSTLLKCLKPVIAPNGEKEGTVYFEGEDIISLSHREQAEKIGFVLQSPDHQIVCDKVWHELAFGLENLGYPNGEIRARVAEMAAFFGIEDLFYKNTSELSGGQKQLLNLAAVMVMQPSVLILDEPTSQLDPIAATDFLETIRKINSELGTTVILSEHRLEEAVPLSDRVIAMEDGRIIADGNAEAVGRALKESNNSLFMAMPAAMRVYYSVDLGGICPVTVREGKKWLSKTAVKNDIDFPENTRISTASAVEFKDIRFRYEKEQNDVLRGLSLKINKGEFYAIVGGNGAGKSTALSLISGINKPYRGKVNVAESQKIAALPQNPQSIFVKKTVRQDLYEAAKTVNEKQLEDTVDFCGLNDVMDSHPYDLSGGEQQRAALAKVLLTEPDILLLDEPTKGLDAYFKSKLAQMLKELCKTGVTVIMVSHDIEFCAKYADRLGMFFDGQLVSEDEPKRFFSGKNFYTTAANRMARDFIPNAVTDTDIIAAIGGRLNEPEDIKISYKKHVPKKEIPEATKKKKISAVNILLAVVFAVLFVFVQMFWCKNAQGNELIIAQIVSILCLGISLWCILPKRDFAKSEKPAKRKVSKRTLLASVMILLLIPVTIYIGYYHLEDKKFYFISLLIILEVMLPFMLVFEGRKPQARELVIISVLCAISVGGRMAFASLPQFKPSLAIIIISAICFGGETGFLVGAITGFVSNFFFGQGPWTPWQMFALGMVGFFAGVIFHSGFVRKNKISISVFGFIATIAIHGVILNGSFVFLAPAEPSFGAFISSIAMGLPFDVVHAVSTVFFLYFAAEPMCEKIDRVKKKYGLV